MKTKRKQIEDVYVHPNYAVETLINGNVFGCER